MRLGGVVGGGGGGGVVQLGSVAGSQGGGGGGGKPGLKSLADKAPPVPEVIANEFVLPSGGYRSLC